MLCAELWAGVPLRTSLEAGEEGGPRGTADRIANKALVEADPLGGKLVDMRGAVDR